MTIDEESNGQSKPAPWHRRLCFVGNLVVRGGVKQGWTDGRREEGRAMSKLRVPDHRVVFHERPVKG